MNNIELYRKLDFKEGVIKGLIEYEESRQKDLLEDLIRRLLIRTEWEDAIKELQAYVGDDPDGWKILWEQLNIVSSYTYNKKPK